MAIRVGCPHCGSALNAPDSAGGKTVKCPKCGGLVILPEAELSEPAPAPAPVRAPVVRAKPLAASPSKSSPTNRTQRHLDDDDEPPKRKKFSYDDDYDEEDDRPRKRSKRVIDDDDEDDRPRSTPKKRKKKKKKSGGLPVPMVAVLAVVGLAGLVLSLIFILPMVTSAFGGPQQAVNKFARSMTSGNYGAAWDVMSSESHREFGTIMGLAKLQVPELQGKTDRELFIYMMEKGNVKSKGGLGSRVNVQKVEKVGDQHIVYVKDPDGTQSEWPVIKEGAVWKVHFTKVKVNGRPAMNLGRM